MSVSRPANSRQEYRPFVQSLFDERDLERGSLEIQNAQELLSEAESHERGAIFTRRPVVDAILDLVGYVPDARLHEKKLLEPSFGGGEFLFAAVDRLFDSFARHGGAIKDAPDTLADALRGIEVHRGTFDATSTSLCEQLGKKGLQDSAARALADTWLTRDDFLLAPIEAGFDYVIGNPPYLRPERIPPSLLGAYRRVYKTMSDRADLYIPFFERGLELLSDMGALGFICANRWMKNKYGGRLRELIGTFYHHKYHLDLVGFPAFSEEVIAYPAITVVTKERGNGTLVARKLTPDSLGAVGAALVSGRAESRLSISRVTGVARGRDPWLLDHPRRVELIRTLEARFPTLEESGCRVGIGVATGCDRVFIGGLNELPVEEDRKVPLVMARDLRGGVVEWGGKGVVNPFEESGALAQLEDFPRFAAYLNEHRESVMGRHVAKKNASRWYRTIDRIYPSLVGVPKLLIPDIKGGATVVLDDGHFYPHHNLYYVTSEEWNLRVLQALLRSSIAVMFVAAYSVRMSGGFLRFQAQNLRRIRVPRWDELSSELAKELAAVAEKGTRDEIDPLVFEAYQLSGPEGMLVREIATEVTV